jgi:hypothetical protein
MNRNNNAHKLTPGHLARKSVFYLRQSPLAQVKHNQESQRLQYALAETARTYGFKHIEIVDCDLGIRAATGAQAREGSDQRAALQCQIQQVHYEAQRAFEQYNQIDPANRLVAEMLEQRWNEKLETLERLQGKPDTHSDAATSLTPAIFCHNQITSSPHGLAPSSLKPYGFSPTPE